MSVGTPAASIMAHHTEILNLLMFSYMQDLQLRIRSRMVHLHVVLTNEDSEGKRLVGLCGCYLLKAGHLSHRDGWTKCPVM